MGKQIALLHDLPGYGQVGLRAVMPILSAMGHFLYNLPTALVSNTLDYGQFQILETTDYMRGTMAVWEKLGFRFDAVMVGFLLSQAQTELAMEFCQKQKNRDAAIFVDPILGDNGRLYNGVTPERVALMRQFIPAADYIVPNYTEAAYLAELPYYPQGITWEMCSQLIDRLQQLGARSILITSLVLDGKDFVGGFDHRTGELFMLPYRRIGASFPGTGDCFAAVLLNQLLKGQSLRQGARAAMDTVEKLILRFQGQKDAYKGFPVEQCLELFRD